MEPKPLDERTPNDTRPDLRAEAPLVAPPRFETPTPRASSEPLVETPSASAHNADRRSATKVVLASMAIAVVASAVLEYQGWQIAFRAANAPTGLSGIPAGGFLRGVVDTFSGSLAVGAATAIAATLIPASWKRPWRALAAGFVLGAAGFLGFLAYLSALAQ
jgi:hypothetical protein